MPNKTDSDFLVAIDSLINEAESISALTHPFEEFCAEDGGRNFLAYRSWHSKVRTVFDTDEKKQYLPHSFFFPEKMEPPFQSSFQRKRVFFGDDPHREKMWLFRKELFTALSEQIQILHDVKNAFIRRANKIEIHIEANGLVWVEPREQNHHHYAKSTCCFRLLKLFRKKTGYVETKTILRETRYTSLSVLSKGKRKINSVLKEKLNLNEDVVHGGGVHTGMGYRINPVYTLVFGDSPH